MAKRSSPDSPSSTKNSVYEDLFSQMQANHLDVLGEIQKIKTTLETLHASPGVPSWYLSRMSTNLTGAAKKDPNIQSLAYASFLVRECAKAPSKSFNAVIEKLPDIPNRNNDTHEVLPDDGKFINDICERGQLTKPTSYWRQPSKNTKIPRVIKVHFDSVEARNSFIFKFRTNLPPSAAGIRRPTCRRDMTVPELNLLYALRKQAYEANQEVGSMKYYVRDLDIAELSNPRPFAPNPVNRT